MSKHKKILVVLDFDNTLFDWVGVWHSSFAAMMAKIEIITGLSVEDLAPEIRQIHQQHGTSEYSFLLGDLPALQSTLNGNEVSEVFGEAILAFRRARKRALRLYPCVAETLLRIKGRGARIAIYTESQSYYSFYRTKRLGLDGVIDRLYTPPDHEVPNSILGGQGRHYNRSFYQLRYTEHHRTPAGELKPNSDLLLKIVGEFGVTPDDAVYVGDSRQKDVAMAKDAGIDHAWAKYGEVQDSKAYELLKLVTHWTDEDVAREEAIRARTVDANIVLHDKLSEIFDHFEFGEFNQ